MGLWAMVGCMIPLGPLRPYLGIAKVVTTLAACVFLYARGHSNGVESERGVWEVKVSEARQQRLDEYEKKLKAAAMDKAKSVEESAVLTAKVKTSEAYYAALLDRIPTKPLVIHEPAKPGEACPPAPRLSPDFRLRYNEAILGTGPAGG